MGHWPAYLSDVIFVAQSELRQRPGQSLGELLLSPEGLVPTLLGITAFVLLRRVGLKEQGVLILLALIAGTYVTYQNYANDPLHLGFIALLLAVWAMQVSEVHRLWLAMLSIGFAATIAPSYLNLAMSPYRLASADRSDHVPILIGSPYHQDILIPRADAASGRQIHIVTDGHRDFGDQPPAEPLMFQGSPLPSCSSVPNGPYFASIVADLADRGLAQGQSIFMADTINPLWLFGDHAPLQNGQPWYYGRLRGLAQADLVLVPVCPHSVGTHRAILAELDEITLTEIVSTPLYRLYAP